MKRDFLNLRFAIHLCVWLVVVLPGSAWLIFHFELSRWHFIWPALWLVLLFVLRYADLAMRELYESMDDDPY